MKLRENGIIADLDKKWKQIVKGYCGPSKEDNSLTDIGFEKVVSMVAFLGIGILASLITMFLETFFVRCIERNDTLIK